MARWKRGVSSGGIGSAVEYAFGGTCDASLTASGAIAAASYGGTAMTRYTATSAGVARDQLDRTRLISWLGGLNPITGERRGRKLAAPSADLLLDSTINAPKSFSIAAVLHPDLAVALEQLNDRIRDRTIELWKSELNARRGAGGRRRMPIRQLEVVELRHERSRAADPHKHRHLWLNMRVQGEDGRWSNLDSRVALRFQTLINAEGDLSARSDPQWRAALAARGYRLDEQGEIAELANLVRPLSRRSAQIEANRLRLLAQWRLRNPGSDAGPDVLATIDRLAWAVERPSKAIDLQEDQWLLDTRHELEALDPQVLRPRAPIGVPEGNRELDREHLAVAALADADRRSTSSQGRFSKIDVRAGAIRALAASGTVAHRRDMEELIDDVASRAVELGAIDLLDSEEPAPQHVKHLMSTFTHAAKTELAVRIDGLRRDGSPVAPHVVARASRRELRDEVVLDADQTDAAAAVAGTDRLVTVIGPAGTGKTTMLRVARSLLEQQSRRMMIVAPTKKAAMVAGDTVGSTAASLHLLLHDYGWRWSDDPYGRARWTSLSLGDVDPQTGYRWEGPSQYPLRRGDRIVLDEAGMLDLDAAIALADVARATGSDLALVGDELQAAPVGHSGSLAAFRNRSSAVVRLSAVHRFVDHEYAELTLRMRSVEDAEQARSVASELAERGLVTAADSDASVRAVMASRYFESMERDETVALITATNEEARAVNAAIQAERVERGELSLGRALVRTDETVLVGDCVQTRQNDAVAGVENRARWRVTAITATEVELEREGAARSHRVVSAGYATEHVQLAYATTVHGVQGETTDRAVVSGSVDAAGLYVGMTRGRRSNEVVVIAASGAVAREHVASALTRSATADELPGAAAAAEAELARSALDREGQLDRAPSQVAESVAATRRPEVVRAVGGAEVAL